MSNAPGASAAFAGEVARDELVYENERARVFWRHTQTGASAPLLCLQPLGSDAPDRLRRELAMLGRLAGVDGVPALAEFPAPAGLIALTADSAGVPLAQSPRAPGTDWPGFLELAQQLARTVAAIHRAGVVHRHIAPTTVLLRDRPPALILAHFDLASSFAEELPAFTHHSEIAGTLAYLAPEQTGRTGRALDLRADLYGMGATLYEWASGGPPFAAGDPLELLHEVLARTPTPLVQRVPGIPSALSEIVQRLLEKEPDRRYQSAEGLLHDLAQLAELLLYGQSTAFPLGERDFPLRLAPPSRLVGREQELGALRDAFERAVHGQGRCVLVAGAPGVGKTALVDELKPLVTAVGGWFVSGKFDQHRQDLTANAGNQAMRALGRLLLAEPEAELAKLRARILAALGPNAGAVSAMVPEFGVLLQVPPELVTGEARAVESRLIQAGVDLLRAIASPARPVVMVLDDLQWASPIVINFVDALLLEPALAGLFLVCPFREADVDAAHPLTAMRARWERLGAAPLLLSLRNLPATDLGALLADMLRLAPSQAASLADAVVARTGGNPYDSVELINALRREGALVPAAHGWSWDDEAIRRYVGQRDVVELLAARIDRLPAETQRLLEVAACLGGEVELDLLQRASGFSVAELEPRLVSALEQGLMLMVYGGQGGVRFRHDRVQQAAYSRLSEPARRALHLTLARRLVDVPELRAIAAAQYLSAIAEVTEPEERARVALLMRTAAVGARAINLPQAERFLATAHELLEGAPEQPWALQLEIERHMVLSDLARFEEGDRLYQAIVARCADPLVLADAVCVQINSLCNRGRQPEAIALGFDMLARLGFRAPGAELLVEIARGLERMFAWFSRADLAHELGRPQVADPHVTALAKLINRIMAPAFYADTMTAFWLVLESQRLWAEHGPCAALVAPLSYAGFVTIAFQRDFRTGYGAVRRVLTVSEAKQFEPETSHARFLFSVSVAHWFEPLEDCLLHARRAREGLLRAGDLQNTCYTYYTTIFSLFDCASLASAAEEIEAGLALVARTGSDHLAFSYMPHRQLARVLSGASSGLAGSFDDESFDERAYLERAQLPDQVTLHVDKALTAALFGDVEQLVYQAAKAMPLLVSVPGAYNTTWAHLTQALALCERVLAAPAERAAVSAELEGCREWFARRAAEGPANFTHLWRLVEAECARAAGDSWAAAGAFDAALREADARQRPWHQALIRERAAQFYLAHGHERSGRALLVEARARYEAWGAWAKVRQLEQRYDFLGAAEQQARQREDVRADAIDLLALLRASQTLSSETSLERLKARVVELLGALTGATSVQVVLWLDQERRWVVSASDGSGGRVSLEEASARGLLPLSAFRYTERTREPLLVEDATRDDRFARDPYLAGVERCSLLVVPIFSQGASRAVLILENRAHRGAFSAERLDAVKLIAGQLAVSLDNALLYASLEQKVADRTAELEQTHEQLLAASRKEGMAEIATNVLHNVGNVLNSVNVSATLVAENIKRSKVGSLGKAVALLREHAHDLGAFFASDPRGKQVPEYLARLFEQLVTERDQAAHELGFLRQNIDHIKEIVALQQTFATASGLQDDVDVRELVEESLRINSAALSRHHVEVVRDFEELPMVRLDKRKAVQILVNLISNAKHACSDSGRPDKRLTLRVAQADGRIHVSVSDNGVGIPPENLTRIFQHGFTTRPDGHGFGLHSGALAADELGGALRVHSDGVGCGATFTLELPLELAHANVR